jgi:putative membrane protein
MSATDFDSPAGIPSHPQATRNRPLPFMLTLGAMLATVLAWAWPLPVLANDLLSGHMAQHLLAMNGGALLLALAWRRLYSARPGRGSKGLVVATALQFSLLMLWHLPPLFAAAHHSAVLQPLMHATTFGAAFLFWRAIFATDNQPLWLRIVCLLATAKLFCLAGAVLVFSRRAIYAGIGDPTRWNMTALSDQQLAGLLMGSACALIYVAVATGLFASWLLRDRAAPSGNEEPVALPR